MNHGRDPLERLGPALAGVLLAVMASLLIAAFVGAAIGSDYETRSGIYLALVAWTVTGGVALFVATSRAEHGPLTVRSVLLWTASLWIWPVLLLLHHRRSD